jgi:predicted dehydrogenase
VVRLGFVGSGYMGQVAHLANYAALDGVELVALADPKQRQAEMVALHYGIGTVYGSHQDLAEDPSIDAVVAILPHAANAAVVKDLLAAGKHVIVEKPLAVSAAQGRELAEAAGHAGRHLCVGYMKRFDPGSRWARDAVASWSGDNPRPTFARAHCFGGDWICGNTDMISSGEPYPALKIDSDGPEFLSTEMRREFQTFTNIYIHNLNLLRFVLGRELEVLSVTTHKGSRVIALAAGDALVTLECGWMGVQWWDEVTTVYFEDGYVDLRTPPPMLRNVPAQVERYSATDSQKTSPVPAWQWAFRNQAAEFLATIRGEIEPVNTAADAVKDLEVAEAIFRLL